MLSTLNKTGNIVLNRALPSYGEKVGIKDGFEVPSEITEILSETDSEISTIVPCFCDLAFKTEKITLFPLEDPTHPILMNLEEILKITEN